MDILNYKKDGYFLEICTDERRKLKGYNLKKQTSETTAMFFEINRSAYLMLKNKYGFNVKKRETSYLNFIPFAEKNKEKTPMYEYLIPNS